MRGHGLWAHPAPPPFRTRVARRKSGAKMGMTHNLAALLVFKSTRLGAICQRVIFSGGGASVAGEREGRQRPAARGDVGEGDAAATQGGHRGAELSALSRRLEARLAHSDGGGACAGAGGSANTRVGSLRRL